MPDKGTIRKFFPGGNTSRGFFSYYDYIMPVEDAARIMVLKGGPGTGKSSFMKKIAEAIVDRGHDVEFCQCSSDNNSLDGVVIPALKVALIDGTAPHVVDPKNPGAVDEIINLGEYWAEDKIVEGREEVIKITKRISRLYKITYSLLAEAKVAYDEWKSYIKDSMDMPKYNQLVKKLIADVFEYAPVNYEVPAKQRHLFATAITPDGPKSYIDTLLKPGIKIYAIDGEPGSGAKETITRIAQTASEMGLFTEQFHCPFEPELVDMVIIPSINTAVLNTKKPFHFDIENSGGFDIVQQINLDCLIRPEILEDFKPELEDAKARFYSLIDKAWPHIHRAKALHDDMEKYYVSAMDFDRITQKREETLQRILKYAEK